MRSIVVYYSLSGHSRKIAQSKAAELNADILELLEVKKSGKFSAFTSGIYKAMAHKKAKLQNINIDFSIYDSIVIVMPIWAGSPAPAFNNLVDLLPRDKNIELILTSDSGNSNQKNIKEFLNKQGLTLVKYTDIKTGSK